VSGSLQKFEFGAVGLGDDRLVASWRRTSADWISKQPLGSPINPPMLWIWGYSCEDDSIQTLAAPMTISTRKPLIALREAIDEALKNGGAA
jgi:hypothetical protein